MDAISLVVGVSWMFTGILLIAVAVPLAMGRVPRNALYGVRFRKSFASDQAWLDINRYGGRRLILWSIPLVIIGIVAMFMPMEDRPGLALTMGLAPMVFIFIPVIEM
jgi:hypothetical protein